MGQGLVAVLLCLLSSVPFAQLTKKAASLFVVLVSMLLTVIQRLRERRQLSNKMADGREQLNFLDAHGTRHEVRTSRTPLTTFAHSYTPRKLPCRSSSLATRAWASRA